MRFSAHGRSSWRGAFLALTMIAVAMRIVVPPGFMAGAGAGPPLVICTGHGPLRLSVDPLGHARAPRGGERADAPCLFAAMAAAPPPALPMVGPAVVSAAPASQGAARESLVAGPTLSAAPPPARAPPAE
jgi:hypothetical protein